MGIRVSEAGQVPQRTNCALPKCEGTAQGARIEPLMRGTLWWVGTPRHFIWKKSDFEKEIQTQMDIGFDLLWLLGSKSAMDHAERNDGKKDVLETLYSIADEKKLRVIIDLIPGGGALPGKLPLDQAIPIARAHIRKLAGRYGHHRSFYGWYLNNELNPLHPSEQTVSAYWRAYWKGVVDECRRAAPRSVVAVSPFFLLDEKGVRGFTYLRPDEYAAWWDATLKETGIDILMLQDSGEHLGFFTLEQREPFWSAVAEACRKNGKQFWLNVETGEVDVLNWDEYLKLEREATSQQKSKEPGEGIVPWRFTPIDSLEKKLQTAAKVADNLVNWGYYPFMDSDGNVEGRKAYESYRAYYLKVRDK